MKDKRARLRLHGTTGPGLSFSANEIGLDLLYHIDISIYQNFNKFDHV
jgi:hypothetical protein